MKPPLGVGGRGGADSALSALSALSAFTHHHHDALVQRTTRLKGLLLAVHGVLPLQAVLDELLWFGVFALCVQDEVSGHLILHGCH